MSRKVVLRKALFRVTICLRKRLFQIAVEQKLFLKNMPTLDSYWHFSLYNIYVCINQDFCAGKKRFVKKYWLLREKSYFV